jgi:hypothetical protein
MKLPAIEGVPRRLALPSRFSLFFAFLLASALCATAVRGAAQKQNSSAPSYVVRIDFNERVRMRDGVELSADIYRPDGKGQFPVILTRTPYNKSTERGNHLGVGRYFAAKRKQVAFACRLKATSNSNGRSPSTET